MAIKNRGKETDDPNKCGRSMRFDTQEQPARSLVVRDRNGQSTDQSVHKLNHAPDRVRDTARIIPESADLFPKMRYHYAL